MKRWIFNIAWLVAFSLIATGCGSGSASTTATTTIVLSTNSATIPVGSTFTFAATVTTSSTNTSVTWQVNGVTGGAAATGLIDTNGDYTAPSTPPNPNTVT